MNDQLDVVVTKSPGRKCPRCWKYWGIEGNHLGMCDECQNSCLEGGFYVREIRMTQLAELERWRKKD